MSQVENNEPYANLLNQLHSVLPYLISRQFVEHCKLSFLLGIQPASSPLLQGHLGTLARDSSERPSAVFYGDGSADYATGPQFKWDTTTPE